MAGEVREGAGAECSLLSLPGSFCGALALALTPPPPPRPPTCVVVHRHSLLPREGPESVERQLDIPGQETAAAGQQGAARRAELASPPSFRGNDAAAAAAARRAPLQPQ